MKIIVKLVLLASIVMLGACSQNRDPRYAGFHFPYKVAMHQGNKLNASQLNSLQLGMYKQQVEETIGSPLLIDTFDQNHWIYIQIDDNKKGNSSQKRVNLFFVNEKLSKIVR